MANSKITDLTAGSPTSGDEYPINRAGADKKLTVGASWPLDSGSTLNWNSADLVLRRNGAANLALGAADASSATAQTLSVQSVVAGTSNTAGADFTISGSQGTGSQPGGAVVLKVAPMGNSGTSQNALIAGASVIPETANACVTLKLQGYGSVGSTLAAVGLTALWDNGLGVLWANNGSVGGNSFFRCNSSNFVFPSGVTLAWTSNAMTLAQSILDGDTFIKRKGAANVQLGAADAASPVAQTLSVQNVATGTSNTAGADFTIDASQGTGTGKTGSIIFKGSRADGTTGTTVNALEQMLKLGLPAANQGVVAEFGDTSGSINNPHLKFSSASGFWIVEVAGGGSTGQFMFGSRGSQGVFKLEPSGQIGFTTTALTTTPDLLLRRGGAANLALGDADAASPVAQTLSVQNVATGTSNTAGVDFTIQGSAGTGTGAGGGLKFQVAPAGGSGTSQNAFGTYLTVRPFRVNALGDLCTVVEDGASATATIINASGVTMGSSIALRQGSGNASSGADVYFKRKGAANWQFGDTDAASPVAQTLSVQNVVAGTSNTAGTDFTLSMSQGTGTGAGGSFILKLAAAGGSGTSQNALAQVIKIDSTSSLTGGVNYVEYAIGTVSSGTQTPVPANGPMQTYTNGGAHTLAPGSVVGNYIVTITNNASAGAITTSGWTKVTGDAFTTTNGNKFRCAASIGAGGSLLVVTAMQ